MTLIVISKMVQEMNGIMNNTKIGVITSLEVLTIGLIIIMITSVLEQELNKEC